MKITDDKIQQQIEAYLNQEMNDFERSKFEKQIHDDIDIHDEVELQQATMEAIRKERVLALKAGLSQVNISLWSVTVMETAKIAAIVAGIGLASLGGYYFYKSSNPESPTNSNSVSQSASPQVIEKQQADNRKEAPKWNSNPGSSETKDVPNQTVFESNAENSVEPSTTVSSENNAKTKFQLPSKPSGMKMNSNAEEKAIENNKSELDEPMVKTVNPANANDIEIPEDGISNKSKLETVNPEVIVKRENKDKFHYQYSDSKLILYADFADKIYEILELNQDNSKKIFLAYEGKYYQLESSKMDITPLKEVSDKHLINILSAYQKRK